MKTTAKVIVAKAVEALWRNPSHSRVTILCYHSIHPAKAYASGDPGLFERHLAWLGEHCDVIDLESAKERCRSTRPTRPAVVITFDDGYRDNYDYAYPLLTKYGFAATFFVTTGFIEQRADVMALFNRMKDDAAVEPMSWSEILEMRDAGFDFGSHTVSHPNLLRLTDDQARGELRQSKDLLQQKLATEIEKLAYPFGKLGRHFTERTVALAAEAGYTIGTAVLFRAVRASDGCLQLPRFFVVRDSIETLSQKVRGGWDFVGWWQETAPRWAARVVSPADFRV